MLTSFHTQFPDKLQALIFDCDGVLFDSKSSNIIFYNKFFSLLDLPPLTAEQEEYAHIHTVDETLAAFVPPEKQHLIAIKAKDVHYNRDILPMLHPEPGLLDFLDILLARNIPMAICTNRNNSIDSLLQHFGLEKYFNPVMTAGRAPAKPAPQGLTMILDTWQLAAQHCIFVGDSILDAQAAHAANMPFVAYSNESLTASLHVSGFPELQERVLPVLQ